MRETLGTAETGEKVYLAQCFQCLCLWKSAPAAPRTPNREILFLRGEEFTTECTQQPAGRQSKATSSPRRPHRLTEFLHGFAERSVVNSLFARPPKTPLHVLAGHPVGREFIWILCFGPAGAVLKFPASRRR